MVERWLAVVGYEGAYEVSDHGRIRSLSREVYAGQGRTRKHRGRLLSIYAGDTYCKVRLKLDGIGFTKNVHQVVAEAFIGPCPEDMEVCHTNCDSHDNRIENLRYDTRAGNMADSKALGRLGRPPQTHCAKGHEFTAENTRIVKRAKSLGGTQRVCRTCEHLRFKVEWQRRLAKREAA